MIFGLWRRESGTIFLDGVELKIKKPEDTIRAGISLVPESRKEK
jgi:ABC-type sugar transport system, ATPase component